MTGKAVAAAAAANDDSSMALHTRPPSVADAIFLSGSYPLLSSGGSFGSVLLGPEVGGVGQGGCGGSDADVHWEGSLRSNPERLAEAPRLAALHLTPKSTSRLNDVQQLGPFMAQLRGRTRMNELFSPSHLECLAMRGNKAEILPVVSISPLSIRAVEGYAGGPAESKHRVLLDMTTLAAEPSDDTVILSDRMPSNPRKRQPGHLERPLLRQHGEQQNLHERRHGRGEPPPQPIPLPGLSLTCGSFHGQVGRLDEAFRVAANTLTMPLSALPTADPELPGSTELREAADALAMNSLSNLSTMAGESRMLDQLASIMSSVSSGSHSSLQLPGGAASPGRTKALDGTLLPPLPGASHCAAGWSRRPVLRRLTPAVSECHEPLRDHAPFHIQSIDRFLDKGHPPKGAGWRCQTIKT